jgi:hypothetical protein
LKKENYDVTFKWASGSRFAADPDKVGKELRKGGKKHTAESILLLARSAETELHKCFVWDDKKAAHLHRMDTARCIGRSLVIEEEVSGNPGETIQVRAFECVNEGTNGESRMAYVPTRQALSDSDMRAQIFKRLADDIETATKTAQKYRALLRPVSSTVERHLVAAGKALSGTAR